MEHNNFHTKHIVFVAPVAYSAYTTRLSMYEQISQ